MRPFSNAFTAFSIIAVIVFSYLTAYGVLKFSFGFALLFMSMILLVASMLSVLPDENELSVHQEILDSGHIDYDVKDRLLRGE